MRLWLIGMMGSGKTTAGQEAADSLGVTFVDTDDEVEKLYGGNISAIWADGGDEMFRSLETEAVCAAAKHVEAIIATGGGAVLKVENRQAMAEGGEIVWLSAGSEAILSRLGDSSSDRPLLTGSEHPADRLETLLDARRNSYRKLADHVIETDTLTVDEVANKISALWNR